LPNFKARPTASAVIGLASDLDTIGVFASNLPN